MLKLLYLTLHFDFAKQSAQLNETFSDNTNPIFDTFIKHPLPLSLTQYCNGRWPSTVRYTSAIRKYTIHTYQLYTKLVVHLASPEYAQQTHYTCTVRVSSTIKIYTQFRMYAIFNPLHSYMYLYTAQPVLHVFKSELHNHLIPPRTTQY
jgi:hypothetical protein